MKRIILHVGAEKTASTSLFTFLKSLQKPLEQGGVFIDYFAHWEIRTVVKNLKNFSNESKELREFYLLKMREYFEQKYASKNIHTILISQEDLIGTFSETHYDAQEIAEAMKLIFSNFVVQVWAFIRRQDTWLESYYNTHIVNCHFSGPFSDFRKTYRACHWDQPLDAYASAFGQKSMLVLPFEEIKHNPKDVARLLFSKLKINVDISDDFSFPRVGASTSKKGVEMAKALAPFIKDEEERQNLRIFLRTNYPKPSHEKHRYFTDAERREVASEHKETNEYVFSKYMPSFPSDYYEKD